MTIKSMYLWSIHYRDEVERSINYYNYINTLQPVWARPLTDIEKKEIFGGNPNYIKNIGRNDGHEWRLLNEGNVH